MATYKDYIKLQTILDDLKELSKREHQCHQFDADCYYLNAIDEAIEVIEAYVNYEPGDEDLDPTPITAEEMHSGAWRQHQELHR